MTTPTYRPDEAPAQRVRERQWWPVALVTVLILCVAGGARGVADALAGAAGPPVRVGAAVSVQPRPGWDLEAAGGDAVRLHRGPVLLDVFAGSPDPQGALAVAQRYVDERLRPGLAQVTVGDAAVTTLVDGVAAVRFGYVGVTHDRAPIEGMVVVANGTRAAAVFDAYAPLGELATVAEDLRAMIDGAAVS